MAHLDATTVQPGLQPVLRVDGLLPESRGFALAELEAMPLLDLGETEVLCLSTGRLVSRAGSVVGVAVRDLLLAAGMARLPKMQLKQCLVVCHGADGYRAIFSWNEVFNTAVGERILVIVRKDGRRLGREAPELSLISAHDLRTGPRNLHRLVRIELRALA